MENRTILILAACGMLAVSPASAQDSTARAAHHRNNCRLAAQVLTEGHPANRRDWALGYIGACPALVSPVLASVWSHPDIADDLTLLIDHSVSYPDRRVRNAIVSVARARSKPSRVRVAALIALARYALPSGAFSIAELAPPDSVGRIRGLGGRRMHVVQFPVSEPIGDVRAETLQLLAELGGDRRNEPKEVWYAASVLERSIGQ